MPQSKNGVEDPEQQVGFLRRWSERKAGAARPTTAPAATDPTTTETPATEPAATESSAIDASTSDDAPETPPTVTEADLDNLSYESDYTKFMGKDVPEALRRRALRQLWRSDPILANVDGLCDYDDDYTDAALAVKVLKTAHRVGQGYLTDEEVAVNQARGHSGPNNESPNASEASNDGDSENHNEDDKEATATNADANITEPPGNAEPPTELAEHPPSAGLTASNGATISETPESPETPAKA